MSSRSRSYSRRYLIISSDAPSSDLPPSDPPEYSDTDDEHIDAHKNQDSLTSDDMPSSEHIPLATIIAGRRHDFITPLPNQIRRPRPRSSSLPIPKPAIAEIESDDVFFTPRTERRLRKESITQKRLATFRINKPRRLEQADEEKSRKITSRNIFFDGILDSLQSSGYSMAEFLQYVFNPKSSHAFDWRWFSFFRYKETVKEVLNYWVGPGYNQSTHTLVTDWAIAQAEGIVKAESKAITNSGKLRKTSRKVDEQFFLGYSLATLTDELCKMAPKSFRLFDAFSTTDRQKREMKAASLQRQELIKGSAILALLRSKSQNNNYAQAVIGTYLMATGAQHQHFSVFSSLGTSMSYNSIIARSTRGQGVESTSTGTECAETEPATKQRRRKQSPGTLYLLSQACRKTAQTIAKSQLFVVVYDNINMMVRVAEQVVGRKNAQENGTCATVIPLYNTVLDDIKTEDLDKGIMNAPPLKLKDLQHTEVEYDLMEEALVHTILSIIVRYGGEGLVRWKDELQGNQPRSSETIPVHKSALHPLPTMEIDENTINGNIAIIEEINGELDLDPENDDYIKYIKFIAGDQLTIARQRAITAIRLGHEVGLNTWKHFVLITGLFHAKIADCHGTLQTHFGVSSTRSPGSLAFHNTCLDRIPIVLSSLPPFRVCRDLIMVSLYARVLHCLLLVSGERSLEVYAKKVESWMTLKKHAQEILTLFANADTVQELREPRLAAEHKKVADEKVKGKSMTETVVSNDTSGSILQLPTDLQGDMVFENACLFLRDSLLSRLFADAIKAGDSGLVVLVLKVWSFSYRGNGRTKYAHEMLHLLHNLINVWTKDIRRVVLQNWLLNPTGKANAFVEIDLVQEHLNFWVKKIYKADGNAHSWDWLALVSPCIDILRKLSTKINQELGAAQGSKHTIPNLDKDIERLMNSLREHKVYEIIPGRVVDPQDRAVPDVVSAGLAQLAHGNGTNPIAEFNQQFERQRERRKLTPLSDIPKFPTLSSATTASPSDNHANTDAIALQNASEFENAFEHARMRSPSPAESDSSVFDAMDPDLEAALQESPTLERIEEEDVELDMDGWDLDEGEMSEDSEVDDECG